MPHIAPSTWIIISILSFLITLIVIGNFSWLFSASLVNFSKPVAPVNVWPWN